MKDVVGVAWFKNERIYQRALSVFADPENLPASYEEWKGLVERQCEWIRYTGNAVLRADIDPETFRDWCVARGFVPNAQGRTAFVNHVVLEYRKTGKGTITK
jgi:hypothetical protein